MIYTVTAVALLLVTDDAFGQFWSPLFICRAGTQMDTTSYCDTSISRDSVKLQEAGECLFSRPQQGLSNSSDWLTLLSEDCNTTTSTSLHTTATRRSNFERCLGGFGGLL